MIKVAKHLVLMITGCLVLIGCSGKEEQSLWGVYQEPVQPAPYPQDSGVVEIESLWEQDLGAGDQSGYAIFRPEYNDGFLYSADRSGRVHKINAGDGTEVWTTDVEEPVFSGVSVGDNIVAITTDSGRVIGISQEDGAVKWSTDIRRQFSALPATGNTRVVVRTADGMVVGLSSSSGNPVWRLEKPVPGLSVHGDSTPTIVGDAVLFGLPTGTLVAANVVNGQEYWEAEIAYIRGTNEIERLIDSDTPPLIKGNVVFTAAYGNHVAALRIEGAETVWKTPVSTRLPMYISGNQLFVTGYLGSVYALDLKSGAVNWEQEGFQGRGVTHPVVIDDRVIIGDSEGKLHTLEAQTGNLVQSAEVVSGAILSIAPGDGQFAILSSVGEVAAFSLQ